MEENRIATNTPPPPQKKDVTQQIKTLLAETGKRKKTATRKKRNPDAGPPKMAQRQRKRKEHPHACASPPTKPIQSGTNKTTSPADLNNKMKSKPQTPQQYPSGRERRMPSCQENMTQNNSNSNSNSNNNTTNQRNEMKSQANDACRLGVHNSQREDEIRTF